MKNPNFRLLGLHLAVLFCSLRLMAVVPMPPTNSYADPWLDFWTFSDTTNWTSDYGFAPISFTNLSVSTLGDGTAVVINDPSTATWLRYNVWETDGTNNLALNEGSLTFWFSPSWASQSQGGSGPGSYGRLLEIGTYNNYGWWGLYFNPAGNIIYFSAQDLYNNLAAYLQAPVSFESNTWHMIGLTWSSTNTMLYIDGALATNGSAISYLPSTQIQSNGFWIGSDSSGWEQAEGTFDDLFTYNTVLDTNDVYSTFVLSEIFYLNGLQESIQQAPAEPSTIPTFDAVSGPGYLLAIATNSSGCVTSTNVWLTNAVASVTNGAVNLTFTIAGGSSGTPYDVFATPDLTMQFTNADWTWMGQGYQCVTYTIPGLTNGAVLLVLGTPQQSYDNGLTDAYEELVLHNNPANTNSGDGMLDGWKVLWGMNPLINNSAQPGERANYFYDGTGRLQTNTGINTELISFDPEGNIQSDQQ